MKAVVAAFNQEKALVGAFSVITNLRMELFEALVSTDVISKDNNHDGSPFKACLLPWAAAALLLLLYGGLELGRVKTLVIILQMTFVPISSSKILIFICAIPFR